MVEDYNLPKQNELKRHGKLMEILTFLGEKFPIGKECPGEIRQAVSIPEQALAVIEEDFKSLRISDISEKLYIGSSYLSTLFKEEYGITLEHYLIIRKIAEAKKYLYMGVPVSKACELSGFNDYSNFIRTFKKFEGCSPSNLSKLNAPL